MHNVLVLHTSGEMSVELPSAWLAGGSSTIVSSRTLSSNSRTLDFPPSFFDAAVCTWGGAEPKAALPELLRVLRPGAAVRVVLGLVEGGASEDDVKLDLLVGGLVNAEQVSVGTSRAASVAATTLTLGASKAQFVVGASEKLSLRKRGSAQIESGRAATAVKLGAAELEQEEFIDEAELLDETMPLPAVQKPKDDCETGKGACENCTCGRAEGRMPAEGKDGEAAPQSACGNCYLGDAYRCANCPSKGLPPYHPDEAPIDKSAAAGGKVSLGLVDDL